jgi:hypothetical protein
MSHMHFVYFLTALLPLCGKVGEGHEKLDWDLSKDNNIDLVGWPADRMSKDTYSISHEIELSLLLPGGIAVKEMGTGVTCKRDSPNSDRVDYISFHLPPCSTAGAYQTAQQYIKRWQLIRQR